MGSSGAGSVFRPMYVSVAIITSIKLTEIHCDIHDNPFPMKTTQTAIDAFLAPRRLAIAGVSRDPKKFGFIAFKELREKGFEVLPINPNAETIDGIKCYPSVASLPEGVESLLLVTPRNQTAGVIREALEKKIPHLWIQQMAESKEALKLAENTSVNLIYKECILMHTLPVKSIHRFHRAIKGFFGLLPK